MTATVNFVVYTGVAPGSGSTQTGIRLRVQMMMTLQLFYIL